MPGKKKWKPALAQGHNRRALGMGTLAWALLYATTFMAILLADGATVAISDGEKGQQLDAEERVAKTAVSSKMRLVFLVGLEGSGHHYIGSSFRKMFAKNHKLQRVNECQLASAFYLTQSMTEDPSTYAQARERARTDMRTLALQGEKLPAPGTVAFLTGGHCRGIGQLSYPCFSGANKVEQYIDVRMLAEVAEAEGVDLRLLYLKRSAREMVIANTQHRDFHKRLGDHGNAAEAGRFMKYMRILFTDIAAIHSGLAELGPGFVVCHDFGELGDTEQATRIAKFVAPNMEVASMAYEALVGNIEPHDNHTEEMNFDDADVVARRLQQKLDVMELSFCGK